MTGARLRALLLAGAGLIAAAALAIGFRAYEARSIAPRPPSERPALLLVTSLPLVFGEQFTLKGAGSPALKALETRYRVLPISVTDEKSLAKGGLLLMAHPLAQPAEDLVALDQWVRHGGRVLLLADPVLEWPSKRPLGDPLRPPPTFMDTGLLAHWGLRLTAPEELKPEQRELGGYDVLTVSPGRMSGRCNISSDGLVAHCGIGKGQATVVADADLLDTNDLGQSAGHNLDALLAELASLEAK
jgi:hypothetical protein